MEALRKYATATHIYVPMIKRSVVDFAVGADWTPAAGDVKVSIDGGAAANIGTLPSAIVMGNVAYWDFTLASGEVTGKKIVVTVGDSATKAVEDQGFVVITYGHASAEIVFDLSSATVSLAAGGIASTTFAAGAITAAAFAADSITAAAVAADVGTEIAAAVLVGGAGNARVSVT